MGFFRNKTSARRDAFEREALPHLDALYATALRLTRSPSDAEDLVQDAMLKAFRFYESFEAGTNMKAWLLRILTNTFINRYRRSVRERRVFDGALAVPVGEGVMSQAAMRGLTSPIADAQRRLLGEEIQRAVDELPEDHRVMILLADVEELSYKEIADIVGCPVGTVMSRLHRARKSLQKSLVDQAVQLGIVADPEPIDADEEVVSLEDWRAKKVAAR
ncbi:MAG: sigma-70 family RNA polymerase sigma factor [Myxococcales bacterium]|nr:sigma-70 family RNA polymerase sigma factor [Myxococcales bacterium]